MPTADVVVVGLGAAGSATLCQLARRGASCIGIDRYEPPHSLGSSHGESRITRLAIGEGTAYTPLVRRSHQIWRELEAQTGARLLHTNGCLVIQDPGETSLHGAADFLGTTVSSAHRFGVEHEELNAAQIAARFPQFALQGDERGCFEPSGGYVRPELCIAAQLDVAKRSGAVVRCNERVLRIQNDRHQVTLRTDTASYSATSCVLSAGAWCRRLLPREVAGLFSVYPQLLTWFEVNPAALLDHRCEVMPVFVWAIRGNRALYGVPALDGSAHMKIAGEQFERAGDPDESTPAALTDRSDVDALWNELVEPRFPGVNNRCTLLARCMYTATPDMGFVVDRLPGNERVLLVSACSGHGFKHSAGVGEAVAQLLTEGVSAVDLSPFRLDRFRKTRSGLT